MYNSAANTNYLQAPTTTAETLNQTTSANTTADSYTIGLGARVDYTKPAGTYTNTFVLTTIANSVPYQINYIDNFSGTDTQYYQESSNNATASGFTLYTGTPTKTGYTFAGWCDGTVTHNTTGNSTCTGSTYQPGGSYSFTNPTSSTTSIANLYAMWNVKTFNLVVTGDAGLYSMYVRRGSSSGTITNGTKSGNTVTFSGLIYGVNYYLYPSINAGYQFTRWAKTDSATNSYLSSTTNKNAYYRIGNGAGALTLTTTKEYLQDFTLSTCQSKASSSSYSLFDKRDNQVYTVRYINGSCWMTRNLAIGCNGSGTTYGSAASSKTLTSSDSNVYSSYSTPTALLSTSANSSSSSGYTTAALKCNATYGAWYNYAAATAGTTSGSSNSRNTNYDICPKGWRLPTKTETDSILSYPSAFNTIGGGYYNSGSEKYPDSAYWWTSTSKSTTQRETLRWNYQDSGVLDHADNPYRYNGIYTRCILKNTSKTISSLTYMQDITPEIKANTADNATTTLTDKRDGKTYKVTKLPDGNLWMTQNLRYLGDTGSSSGSMVMKTATSNITADKTISYGDLTSGNTYTAARLHVATSDQVPSGASYTATDMGVWYNYAAATAKTIASSSTTTAASQDICPKGWRLPTKAEQTGITSYISAYSPITGGRYGSGSYGYPELGRWWSATSQSETTRYMMNYDGSSLSTSYQYRHFGLYVRCIAK
jgi:uncharacterized protein (TIGR02145 family)